MSANYHSFRNIGFYFTQAEAICEKWRAVFTGFDPSVAVRVYGLRQEGAYVYVMYFGNEYRLCTADGILEKRIPNGDNGKGDSREGGAGEGKPEAGACENVAEQHMENGEKEILWDWDTGSRVLHTKEKSADAAWTQNLFMNEAMVVYHLLGDVKEDACLSGVWVPEPDLDPVKIRSGNRTDPLVGGFAAAFSGRTAALDAACEKMGGIRLARGDAAWQMEAMPLLPVQLIFWDADEEFPAQVQVLVDRNITDFMHFEAAGCMIADLFEKIGALAEAYEKIGALAEA